MTDLTKRSMLKLATLSALGAAALVGCSKTERRRRPRPPHLRRWPRRHPSPSR